MNCKNCTLEFISDNKKQIFCNDKCKSQYHSKNRSYSITCEKCHNDFNSKHKEQKFCSLKCSNSDVQKYSEMGKKGAAKRYNGKVLVKNIIKKCLYCEKDFTSKKSEQKYCNRECSTTHNIILIKNGTIKMNSNNRGKAEMYLSELCIEYFGIDDILCNEKIFKDNNGGLWDADIIIKSLKLAILYDGIFHHKQVKKDHNLIQIQTRDKIKRSIILNNGYEFYTINDLGKFNKKFVEEHFYLLIHKIKFKTILKEFKVKIY